MIDRAILEDEWKDKKITLKMRDERRTNLSAGHFNKKSNKWISVYVGSYPATNTTSMFGYNYLVNCCKRGSVLNSLDSTTLLYLDAHLTWTITF